MASEYAKLGGVFQIGGEGSFVRFCVTGSQQKDFLVGLDTKGLQGDSDGNVFMNRVMSKIDPAFFGGDIGFGFETTMCGPLLQSELGK